jgi:hypothetical protein
MVFESHLFTLCESGAFAKCYLASQVTNDRWQHITVYNSYPCGLPECQLDIHRFHLTNYRPEVSVLFMLRSK